MARPKKKPEYDSDQMAQQLMEAVTDAYLNPPQGTEDGTGHMQLKQLAEEFSMTPLKVRKLLITTGAYQTAISKAVNTLFREGKSIVSNLPIFGHFCHPIFAHKSIKKAAEAAVFNI